MQTNLMQNAAYGLSTDRLKRPDFAELDVFLGQHILLQATITNCKPKIHKNAKLFLQI